MDKFQAAWQGFHHNRWPIGHRFSKYDGWNLTRFHLMPDARVLVDSRDEMLGLLDRFNTLAREVLGEHKRCWLILAQGSTADGNAGDDGWRKRLARLKKRYGMKESWAFYSPDDALTYTAYAAEVTWQTRSFNRLFIDIYREKLWDVVWMNPETGALFSPHSVSADISQPTPHGLMSMVSRFYGWLPLHGHGFLRFDPSQMKDVRFQVSKACSDAINRAVKG